METLMLLLTFLAVAAIVSNVAVWLGETYYIQTRPPTSAAWLWNHAKLNWLDALAALGCLFLLAKGLA